jgi:hypothetical protein
VTGHVHRVTDVAERAADSLREAAMESWRASADTLMVQKGQIFRFVRPSASARRSGTVTPCHFPSDVQFCARLEPFARTLDGKCRCAPAQTNPMTPCLADFPPVRDLESKSPPRAAEAARFAGYATGRCVIPCS